MGSVIDSILIVVGLVNLGLTGLALVWLREARAIVRSRPPADAVKQLLGSPMGRELLRARLEARRAARATVKEGG